MQKIGFYFKLKAKLINLVSLNIKFNETYLTRERMTTRLEDSLINNYQVHIKNYIDYGWLVLKNNMGLFVFYTVINFMITLMLQIIPIVGPLVQSLLVSPCIAAGYYIAAQKGFDGKYTELSDFFRGFDHWKELLISTVFNSVFIMILLSPLFFLFGVSAFLDVKKVLANEDIFSTTAAMISITIFLIGVVYMTVSYLFVTQFIIFHKMEAWPAMELSRKLIAKKWLYFFVFGTCLLLFQFLGTIFCFIGLLVTMPLMYCALHAAFRDIAGLEDDELVSAINNIGNTDESPNRHFDEDEI